MTKQKNEQGLVSIVIVSVIIIILALMTMGFSKIMDRELRQSLDRGLSTQAYYAAESGLNDAREYVSKAVAEGKDPSTPEGECLNPANPPGGVSINPFVQRGSISGHFNSGDAPSADGLIKYTCVLIDATPEELVYEIEPGQSRVFKVIATGANPIDSIYLGWENKSYGSTGSPPVVCIQPIPGSGGSSRSLPKESDFSSACQTGMIRTTIYPVPASMQVAGDSAAYNTTLANLSRTYFMYSNSGSQATSANIQARSRSYTSANGAFISGECNIANHGKNTDFLPYKQATGRYCNGSVADLTSSGADFYYVRVTALYKKMTVALQASDNTASNSTVSLGGAQALIDVTAQGNDVLRRLQARAPLEGNVPLPEYALQSIDTYCKHLRRPKTGPGLNTFGDTTIDDPGRALANIRLACQPEGAASTGT